MEKAKVYNNILEAIGQTPMVKLQRIPKQYGLECEIYAKCEFMNPGGSIKERIAYKMVLDAQKRGLINQDSMFVEPTSGNTGIGVALVAAILGYKATIVTPDKNSDEKMNTMRLLGAKIIQTPASAFYGSPENFMAVTQRILDEVPNTHSCDQYINPVNPHTHYEDTAEEILAAVPDVNMVVMGAGTGGTVTGVAQKMKEKRGDHCVVVAVDPQGSIMFQQGNAKVFYVEGIGGDFIPEVLDKKNIDLVISPNDKDSFNMAREVNRKEGLLCGGSSGAAMYSAIQAAKKKNLGPGSKVVVILPDGIRNYMTKFVSDQWMEANLFREPEPRHFWWYNQGMSHLPVCTNVPRVSVKHTVRETYIAMNSDHDVALVVSDEGYLRGVTSKDCIRNKATNPLKKEGADFNDPINKYMLKHYYKVIANRGSPTVGFVSRILDIAPFVVVVDAVHNEPYNDFSPRGIIAPDSVLDFIMKNPH